MTEKILQGGQVMAVNNQADQVAALAGLGLTGDLAAAEAASWRRWLPAARMPWKEIRDSEGRSASSSNAASGLRRVASKARGRAEHAGA